jgi:hypothetical protein
MQDALAMGMTEHIQRRSYQRMMWPDDRNA